MELLIESLRAFRRAALEKDAEDNDHRSCDSKKTLQNRLEAYEHMSDLLSVIERCPKKVPTWPKIGPRWPKERPKMPKMGPSWAQHSPR